MEKRKTRPWGPIYARPLYLCSPTKNTECPKTSCAFYGRSLCFATSRQEFARNGLDRPLSRQEIRHLHYLLKYGRRPRA